MIDVVRNAAVLLALSVLGWKIFAKLKCPAPEILGSMALVIVGNVLGLDVTVHPYLNTAITIFVGISIGSQFNVKLNMKLVKEITLVCTWLIATGLLIGRLLMLMGIDADTAMFSSLPGGITELTFISISFDANPFQVTLFHATRMVTLLIFMPIIIRAMPADTRAAPAAEKEKLAKKAPDKRDWLAVIIISAVSGVLLQWVNVPVGAMLGPMITTALYSRLRRIQFKFMKSGKGVLDSLVGGVVGAKVTRESILTLPSLILPLITLDILVILSSLALGYILYRISSMNRVTAQLASVPGGFSPFVMLADSMGADVSRVAVFHLCRYMSMILFSVIQGLILRSIRI